MYEFKQLALLLQKELGFQTALEELLAGERVAIIKLDSERLEQIAKEKDAILQQASQTAERRDAILNKLFAAAASDTPRKLSALYEAFEGDKQLKIELEKLTRNLKEVSTRVQDRNEHNAVLIRQTLGIVTSTISIFRSAVTDELPTYKKTGSLRTPGNDSATPNVLVSRSA